MMDNEMLTGQTADMFENDLSEQLVDTLVLCGFLSPEQAQQAVEKSRTTQISLLTHLINQQLIKSSEIAVVVSKMCGLPLVDIESIKLNPELIKLFDQEFLQQHQVLPLFMRGNCLFVAISDPTHSQLIAHIKAYTGKPIEIILAENDKLIEVIKRAVFLLINPLTEENIVKCLKLLENPITVETETVEEALKVSDDKIIKFVNQMIHRAITEGADELHFEPYEKFYRVRFRIDDVLREIAKPPVQLADKIAACIKAMSRLDVSECRISQYGYLKFKLSKKALDFQVSTCPTVSGEKIVLQYFTARGSFDIDILGFEEQQKRLYLEALANGSGMILVTGPHKSGKTFTLYTGLNILNRVEVNIYTAEKQIYFYLPGLNRLEINEKSGIDFYEAIRMFSRQNPDVILVDEISDRNTADIAIEVAKTCLVMSTIPNINYAPQVLTCLIDIGISPLIVAHHVTLVIAQRLVRRLCSCKIQQNIPEHALLIEGFKKEEIPELKLYAPKPGGCGKCGRLGYKGRVNLFQVMPISDQMKQLIMKGRNAITLAEQAKREGIPDLRESGLKKVKDGLTSLEELYRIGL